MTNYPGPTYAMLELDFGVRMVRAERKSAPCCPTVSRQNGCMSARQHRC